MLDLNMPRIDGWTVLASIANNQEIRTIPVVVLSSSCRDDDQARAFSLGARQYVIKPFAFGELVEIAKSICADFLPAVA